MPLLLVRHVEYLYIVASKGLKISNYELGLALVSTSSHKEFFKARLCVCNQAISIPMSLWLSRALCPMMKTTGGCLRRCRSERLVFRNPPIQTDLTFNWEPCWLFVYHVRKHNACLTKCRQGEKIAKHNNDDDAIGKVNEMSGACDLRNGTLLAK